MTRTPPGPRGLAPYGFLRAPLDFFRNTARQFGPFSHFRLLGQRIYLIDDADLIQEVLVTRQHLFDRDTGATLLRELLGDALVTRDEPAHKERRRQLQPAFHRAQIAAYAEMMSAECVRSLSRWSPGARLDVASEMKRLTLSIVGASLFGADFTTDADRIAAVLSRVIRRSRFIGPAVPILEPWLRRYRRNNPNGRSVFFQTERDELERILQPVIARRRSAQTEDILSHLLDQLDDRDAVNEIVTLVLAGHETTATALSWAWHLVAAHPESAGDLTDPARAAVVFNEAMRLYPPAPAFGRRPKEDLELGGFRIPARSSVFLSPYVTHRNPKYFAEPDRFLPDRWHSIDIPKFAYFPFGGGAKMCIGDNFARMEGGIVLSEIAKRFRLVPDDPSPLGYNLGITLRPNRPLWMRVQSI